MLQFFKETFTAISGLLLAIWGVIAFKSGHKKTSQYIFGFSLIFFVLAIIFNFCIKSKNETDISISKNETDIANMLPGFSEELTDHEIMLFEMGSGIKLGREVVKLKKHPFVPLGIEGNIPFKLYLDKNKLYIDASLYSMETKRSLKIIKNKLIKLPIGWDSNFNETALEIVDNKTNPILQIIYKKPLNIKVNGYFHGENGILFADDVGFIHLPFPAANSRERVLSCIFKYPSWRYKGVYKDHIEQKP